MHAIVSMADTIIILNLWQRCLHNGA